MYKVWDRSLSTSCPEVYTSKNFEPSQVSPSAWLPSSCGINVVSMNRCDRVDVSQLLLQSKLSTFCKDVMPNEEVRLQRSEINNHLRTCANLHGIWMSQCKCFRTKKKVPCDLCISSKLICAFLCMYFRRNLYKSTSLASLINIESCYKGTCCVKQHRSTGICSAWNYLHYL